MELMPEKGFISRSLQKNTINKTGVVSKDMPIVMVED